MIDRNIGKSEGFCFGHPPVADLFQNADQLLQGNIKNGQNPPAYIDQFTRIMLKYQDNVDLMQQGSRLSPTQCVKENRLPCRLQYR